MKRRVNIRVPIVEYDKLQTVRDRLNYSSLSKLVRFVLFKFSQKFKNDLVDEILNPKTKLIPKHRLKLSSDKLIKITVNAKDEQSLNNLLGRISHAEKIGGEILSIILLNLIPKLFVKSHNNFGIKQLGLELEEQRLQEHRIKLNALEWESISAFKLVNGYKDIDTALSHIIKDWIELTKVTQ